MKTVTPILSMLHEPADRNSATRRFREQPVVKWTVERLSRCSALSQPLILCWDDQRASLEQCGMSAEAIATKGERQAIPTLDAITAASKWFDGWRGGMLQTSCFDIGFHPRWTLDAATERGSDEVLLVDPAAGLVDPQLIEQLLAHADGKTADMYFSPATPGLTGLLVRKALLEKLAAASMHPGRLLHYLPEQPANEPIAANWCAPIPTPIARTTHQLRLNSQRQIRRIDRATQSLNGQLISTGAERLVSDMARTMEIDQFPREIVLELSSRRATRPIFSPATHLDIQRSDMSLALARELFAQISDIDDVRLTLAGVGDPLLNVDCFEIIDAAKAAGIGSIYLETDLYGASVETVRRLACSAVDIVSVHLPACTHETYQSIMGVDGMAAVLDSIKQFVIARQSRGSGVPLLVPLFAKCNQNMAEMERWYDQWLLAVGSAVIFSPSDCAGRIPPTALADMAPPRRKACARISSRLTILSDGRIVACEEDVLGTSPLGQIGRDTIADVWQVKMSNLRRDHASGEWSWHPLCAACKEWHRP